MNKKWTLSPTIGELKSTGIPLLGPLFGHVFDIVLEWAWQLESARSRRRGIDFAWKWYRCKADGLYFQFFTTVLCFRKCFSV